MRFVLISQKRDSYLIHQLQLLSSEVGAVLEGHRIVVGHLGDMAEPHLEEADLDQDQLIILRELAEPRHSLRKFHHPLHRRCHPRGELLPQPDPLRLDRLRSRRRRFRILRAGGLRRITRLISKITNRPASLLPLPSKSLHANE